ncbi:DUF3604 domain-containing protein [Shewanella sp. 125m-7]
MLWDDTHRHTSYSADAGMFGNRLGRSTAVSNLKDIPPTTWPIP